MNTEQQAFLEKVIIQKRENLWGAQWELSFIKEHHKNWLTEAGMEAARNALADERAKESPDVELLAKFQDDIEQIKDCKKLVSRLEVLIPDIEAQIAYLEGLRGKETSV